MKFENSHFKEGADGPPQKALYRRFHHKKTDRNTAISDWDLLKYTGKTGWTPTTGRIEVLASQGMGLQARWPWATPRDSAARRWPEATVVMVGVPTPEASQGTAEVEKSLAEGGVDESSKLDERLVTVTKTTI